jgi:hypothetical protein
MEKPVSGRIGIGAQVAQFRSKELAFSHVG